MVKTRIRSEVKSEQGARREVRFYGASACTAIWRKRRDDIIRVYAIEETVPQFRELLSWCAKQRKAYHIIASEELNKICKSVHHEGVCVLALEPEQILLQNIVEAPREHDGGACLVYLDGVVNPHNIGSILRVAAHFGVCGIAGKRGELPRLSPSMARIAKGGAEEVPLIALESPGKALQTLRAGSFRIVGASQRTALPLYKYDVPEKSVLVLGAESSGISRETKRFIDDMVTIPGSGKVESLNVAVACGLILGEFWRQGALCRVRG